MSYGNIVLANSKSNWISQCIKWFTKSQFSHSFITMPEVLGIPMCIEASGGGVDTCRYDSNYLNNLDEGIQVWEINIDQEIKDQAIKQTINYLEVSYGFLQYPFFIYRKLNNLFGKNIKSQNNWNTNGMICSQLCVTYLKACGLEDIFKEYGEGSIAPQDLQDIFKSNTDLFKIVEEIRL